MSDAKTVPPTVSDSLNGFDLAKADFFMPYTRSKMPVQSFAINSDVNRTKSKSEQEHNDQCSNGIDIKFGFEDMQVAFEESQQLRINFREKNNGNG